MDPLSALGYDAQYAAAAALLLQPGQDVARVIAVDRESYMVGGERGDLRAEVAGRLRFTADTALDLPGVGDWVTVTCSSTGDLAVIHAVLPRRTLLQRKTAGRVVDCQLIAANLDVAFILQEEICIYRLLEGRWHISMKNKLAAGGVTASLRCA